MDNTRLNNLRTIKKCGLNILANIIEMDNLKMPLDKINFDEIGAEEKALIIEIFDTEARIQEILSANN